jgi:hypothetical protein
MPSVGARSGREGGWPLEVPRFSPIDDDALLFSDADESDDDTPPTLPRGKRHTSGRTTKEEGNNRCSDEAAVPALRRMRCIK